MCRDPYGPPKTYVFFPRVIFDGSDNKTEDSMLFERLLLHTRPYFFPPKVWGLFEINACKVVNRVGEGVLEPCTCARGHKSSFEVLKSFEFLE